LSNILVFKIDSEGHKLNSDFQNFLTRSNVDETLTNIGFYIYRETFCHSYFTKIGTNVDSTFSLFDLGLTNSPRLGIAAFTSETNTIYIQEIFEDPWSFSGIISGLSVSFFSIFNRFLTTSRFSSILQPWNIFHLAISLLPLWLMKEWYH
jgi:hypothetical protein